MLNYSYTLTVLYRHVKVSKVTDRRLDISVYRLSVWTGFWSFPPYQKWSGDNTASSLLEMGDSSPQIKLCDADSYFDTGLAVPWLRIGKTLYTLILDYQYLGFIQAKTFTLWYWTTSILASCRQNPLHFDTGLPVPWLLIGKTLSTLTLDCQYLGFI